MKLKEKAIMAAFWNLLENIGGATISLVVGVVLARLLVPADFGLIGMVTVFIAVSQVFIDSGFGSALIQKQNITKVDISTVFYFNLIVSIILALTLYFAASQIAQFYNQLILEDIIKVMSINLVIGGIGTVHRSLLQIELDFKSQFRIIFYGKLFSGAIGVFMAVNGFAVWSIVGYQIASQSWNSIAYWIVSKWRPGLVFSFSSIKILWNYGSKLMAASLIRMLSDNIYLLVIGKVFAVDILGYYTQAKLLKEMPVALINSSIGNVAFPVLSQIQYKNERFTEAVKRSLQTMSFLTLPMMATLLLLAEPLVRLLLTEKWLPSVPLFQIMCLIGMIYPIHLINVKALLAKGRSDIFLKLGIVKNIFRLANIFFMYPYGILHMIWGELIVNLISLFINTYYSQRIFRYGIIKQMIDVLPYVLMTILMIAGMLSIELIHIVDLIPKLILQMIVGGFIYIIINYYLNTKAMITFLEIFKVLLNKTR